MKYYKFTSGTGEIKWVALPSEIFLTQAIHLVFRDEKKGLPFKLEDECFIYTPSENNCSEGERVASFVEIGQDDYRKITGQSHLYSPYSERECYFKGKLPENWYEIVSEELTSGGWIDQIGWENDFAKMVEGEIDSLPLLKLLWDNMFGLDPILELEAIDRWLYGESIRNNDKQIEKQNCAKQNFSFQIDCKSKIWLRHTVTIEANSLQEAQNRVIELAKNHPISMDDGELGLEVCFEPLYESEQIIEPSPNESTVIVMNANSLDGEDILYENKGC